MSSRVDDRPPVSTARSPILARAILGFTILATGGGIALTILDASRGSKGVGRPPSLVEGLPFLIAFIAFPIVGYLLASRRPDNAISWVLAGVGATFALDNLLSSYWPYALWGGVGGQTLGSYITAIESPMWVPIVALPATFLVLLSRTATFRRPGGDGSRVAWPRSSSSSFLGSSSRRAS